MTDPFADIRVGIPQEILWITVAFELWLAFENWRIRDHRVLACIDTMTFAVFAIFAGVRWALGYVSCGCAGNFELPPWLFVLLDVGIVAVFLSSPGRRLLVRSGAQELASWWNCCTSSVRGGFAGLLLFVGYLGFLQLPIAAKLRSSMLGQPPIQAIVQIDSDLILRKESVGQVEIWNRSSQPAKVIGVERSCRCFNLSDDPIAQIIPAQQRISLPVVIKPNKSGPLHQRVVLFLDHPKLFRMNIDVVGTVKGEYR